jgi:hypothetical protein
MLTLHISCAYGQLECLLVSAFIVAHIAHHHLEHFYTLTSILVKLLYFLHFSSSLLHFCIFLGGSSLISGSVSFYPCLCLMSSIVNKRERF